MARAMIVSLQPDAVEVGARVLARGGNAVDAALACAFVQTVVDPMMCGIAGFGIRYIDPSWTRWIMIAIGALLAAMDSRYVDKRYSSTAPPE